MSAEEFESLPPAVRRKVRVHLISLISSFPPSPPLSPITRSDFSFPSPIASSTEGSS